MAGPTNNMSPQQNWQSLGGAGLNGYNNQGGYGGPVARGDLDAIRIGTGRVPSAEYPDGYLGTIRSRRDDRLLDSIKNRVGQKSYQRGVHKGERIEPSAYYWSPDFNDQSSIKRQMKAKQVNINGVMVWTTKKYTQDIRLTPAPHLVNDGKSNMRSDAPGTINVQRANQLNYLKSPYR
ncbi:hypothetical protein UFOVP111_35 [uncultured Caudovirales phage]|uniref:Uncharacterized protein n=1 Tax=uncultured Caudovirales phage TaxID=2100421 RepID=A0A6J5L752_9CAUD|nr:hypothetical protein UFOVP111_35 [uncultured Caudovirales phage]